MIVGTPSELVVPSAIFVSVTAVTVIARWAIVKESSTLGAAAYEPLPACEARTVQVPAVTTVTLLPATVHTDEVSDAKPTVRPLVAVPEIPTGAPPYVALLPDRSNEIVWASSPVPTGKLCWSWGAASWFASPAWSAERMHVPSASAVTTPAAMWHTAAAPGSTVMVAGRPLVAVAVGV